MGVILRFAAVRAGLFPLGHEHGSGGGFQQRGNDMLTRETLEQKRERAYKVFTVPHPEPALAGLGETEEIRLRSMFGSEWLSLVRSVAGDSKAAQWRDQNYSQLVLAFCLVDEDGKRILSDDDLNTAWWKTQSKGFLTASIDAAMTFSGLRGEGVEAERKNLQRVGGSANSTELPLESDQESDVAPPEILSSTLA